MPALRTALALPALFALLVAGTAPATAANPAWPLVFTSGKAVLFLAPGTAKARTIGQGRSPDLSPDGKRAVWIEQGEDAATARLVLCDLDTGATSVMAKPGGFLHTPRFIQGGQAVVFVRLGEGATQELWLARPGDTPTRLARAGGDLGDSFFEPMWFPAEGFIGYNDMRNLYTWKPTGGLVRTMPLADLAPGHEAMFTSADRVAASPDGASLVFSLPVPGTPLFRKKVPDLSSALFLYDVRSGKTTQLTPPQLTAFAPAWTPDGKAVVFTGYTDAQAGERDPFRIWIVHPGGAPQIIGKGEDAMPPAGR